MAGTGVGSKSFMQMMKNTCRICGSSRLNTVRLLTGERTGEVIPIYECAECDAFISTPIAYQRRASESIAREGYGWTDSVRYSLAQEIPVKLRTRAILSSRIVKRAVPKGRMLDIGCGVGWSLVVAKEEFGYEVAGVEPELHTSQYAREELGLAVKTSFFSHGLFMQNYFDFIMSDQVLEHVAEPKTFLSNALFILKPGGVLFIGIPPVDWFRLFLSMIKNTELERFNVFNDPEEHINYFRLRTMKLLVESVGATLVGMHHSRPARMLLSRLCNFSTGAFFIQKCT